VQSSVADVVRNFVVDATTQLRHAHRETERAELKSLYDDFIAEASRLFIEALTNKTNDMDEWAGTVIVSPATSAISCSTRKASAASADSGVSCLVYG